MNEIPKFPRTKHAPIEPNTGRDDLVESDATFWRRISEHDVSVQEKVDGANCGVGVFDGIVVARNRNHVLNKGFVGRGTPAKQQFAPLFNWAHMVAGKLQALNETFGQQTVLYGEWMYAKHQIAYEVPDYFLAFDLWLAEERVFVAPPVFQSAVESVGGIALVPILPSAADEEAFRSLRDGPSGFRPDGGCREGIVIKLHDGTRLVERYKMVRREFAENVAAQEHWNKMPLTRNRIRK